MKKHLLLSLLLLAGLRPAIAQEPLETAIKKKDWTTLATLFSDQTHQQLIVYFKDCLGVGFSLLRQDDLMYFARFKEFAEIGEITFERDGDTYRQLSLKRNLKPLYFVDHFSRTVMTERTVSMGDAVIHFKNGVMYRGMPMGNVFVFCGDWEFSIRPESEEERLTLLSQVRSDTFVKEAQAGVFVFSQPEFMDDLPPPTAVRELADGEAKLLYDIFQQKWGMHIPFFNELWYFPFALDFNTAVFYRKPGKSFYRYVFSSGISPDTSLVMLPENKFYLNYNAVKGLKFTSQGVDELENLQLNIFYNPQVEFLSATAVLNFKEPSSVKTVSLDSSLVVKGYGKSQQHELQLFNRADTYFLLGQGLNKFSFYYAGSVKPGGDAADMIRINTDDSDDRKREHYFILNRDQDFYPNPGPHFFKNRVKITLPAPLQCLVTGELRSQQTLGERNEFVFESPGSKGVSLVCGNFTQLLTIPSRVPIRVFGLAKLKLSNYFDVADIQGCFDFLLDKFGPLEVKQLNMLLRRREEYGGLSNQGFVIFNLLDKSGFINDEMSITRRMRKESPVVFDDVNRDNLVHELSHQWWGGIISWKGYQDQWLTEGLAEFSTLFYLEHHVAENQYRKAIASANKWVFRCNDAGPIAYGRRIANLSNDMLTYQSIVYDKSALVFLMLKEILGEEEMLKRLRELLNDYKYQSLVSTRFIQNICQGDVILHKFFNGWVFSRLLPEVSYRVVIAGPNAEIVFSQSNTDFVFPVRVRITTAVGETVRTLVVEDKEQKFKLTEKSPIRSIEVDAGVSPIKLND
ncbi:MAG: M1 family aminopeptidase [Candidatus Aminicenantes bacterium]|nr:M1 family aminopeptidase [Candidatus Aminicenantes bacterium]